ncbi:MAG: twin transmembrane helix small protein [Alphaproteobacteria bacterium]|nr:twin transmembrane helix small protein [Alphaproteobacteria bacterium]
MAGNFIYVVYAAMAFLVIVLASGLWTMLKGGQPNKSQKMMRWRLGAQVLLIILVLFFVVFFKAG